MCCITVAYFEKKQRQQHDGTSLLAAVPNTDNGPVLKQSSELLCCVGVYFASRKLQEIFLTSCS